MWVDGYCSLFTSDLKMEEALNADNPMEAILEKTKSLAKRKVAVVLTLYSDSDNQVNLSISKIFVQ